MRHLYNAGYPIAVGTNAERGIAEKSLSIADLLSCASALVSLSDGVAPKPSPDIFERAAARLGSPAENTLVIEDSLQGLIAARAAGMPALLVRDPSEQDIDRAWD